MIQPPRGPLMVMNPEPWTIVTVEGVLTDVLNLTDKAIQAELGTTQVELIGEWRLMQALGQLAPTQLLGRVAHDTGSTNGLSYVSAKNPAMGRIFAAFSDRLTSDGQSYLQVSDPHGHISQRLP